MAGEMVTETFKELMPLSYATLRGNFEESVSGFLFRRIFELAQIKMMKHDPSIMTQRLKHRIPNNCRLDIQNILYVLSLDLGTDPVINDFPYIGLIVEAFGKNIQRRCDIFPVGSNGEDDRDNIMIRDIYYKAYRVTAYQFQEEIENSHRLDEIFHLIHDEDGFVQGLVESLRHHIIQLPSQVLTLEDLLQDVEQHDRARAVTERFIKITQVLKEFPDLDKCLFSCWVCGADGPVRCPICHVAAFCGREECYKFAWRKNHKVLCPHYHRTRRYIGKQCRRIDEVHRQGFILDSRMKPNQFFDYNVALQIASMEAKRVGEPLRPPSREPSVDHLYENLVKVANDENSFRALFKDEDGRTAENYRQIDKLWVANICAVLAYNGNCPNPMPQFKLTRSAFLQIYCDLEFVWPSMGKDMVKTSASEDLWKLYNNTDYRTLSKEPWEALLSAVANPPTAAG